MQTQTYRSPSLIPAGAIADMTAAAHIDRHSPEPSTTVSDVSFRSPEPSGTMGFTASFRSPEPVERFRFAFRSPEPLGTKFTTVSFRSPEPGNTGA